MYSIGVVLNFAAVLFNLIVLDNGSPFPAVTVTLVIVNLLLGSFMTFKAIDTGEW